MHIRLVEQGDYGKRIAIDVEGELVAIVRRILAGKSNYTPNIEAILFDWDCAILFNPAGFQEYRLEGRAARELREKLGAIYPALLP